MTEKNLTVAQNPELIAIERVLVQGDLAKLNPEQRMTYLKVTCERLGLNPLARPFDFITLNGKLVMYANKGCAEQLRSLHKISVTVTAREQVGDLFVVTANARDTQGREDSSTGAVSIAGLKGEMLANAMMKAETKAKRRVTLSICGLNMLDDSEVETLRRGQPEADQSKLASVNKIIHGEAVHPQAVPPEVLPPGDPEPVNFDEAPAIDARTGEVQDDPNHFLMTWGNHKGQKLGQLTDFQLKALRGYIQSVPKAGAGMQRALTAINSVVAQREAAGKAAG